MSEDLLEEIELESVERFTGLHNAHINDRARYYVTHSLEHNKVSLSELRKIRNKSKKIKRSYKKQLRRQKKRIQEKYCTRYK